LRHSPTLDLEIVSAKLDLEAVSGNSATLDLEISKMVSATLDLEISKMVSATLDVLGASQDRPCT